MRKPIHNSAGTGSLEGSLTLSLSESLVPLLSTAFMPARYAGNPTLWGTGTTAWSGPRFKSDRGHGEAPCARCLASFSHGARAAAHS